MVNAGRAPDAFYIGYQKSGSTLLRSYFEYHPNITWTRNAATLKRLDIDSPLKEYRNSFPENVSTDFYIDTGEGLATGELVKPGAENSSVRYDPTAYLSDDFEQNIALIASRFYEANPNAKILITLRNQRDWLRSNWLHFLRRLPDDKNSFSDFLMTREGKVLLYSGNYHLTIQAFQTLFGRVNVKVILLEQIRDDVQGSLNSLCDFLRVEPLDFPETEWDRNEGRSQLETSLILRLGRSWITRSREAKSLYNFGKGILARLPRQRTALKFRDPFDALYSASNLHTSHLIGLDIKKFGYT